MYDKAWSALIEMCIAMTIFREEFSTRFVALATALSFVKIFHWLTEHRLEYVRRPAALGAELTAVCFVAD